MERTGAAGAGAGGGAGIEKLGFTAGSMVCGVDSEKTHPRTMLIPTSTRMPGHHNPVKNNIARPISQMPDWMPGQELCILWE